MKTRHSETLQELVRGLYSREQVAAIEALTPDQSDLHALIRFDDLLDGPSLTSMNHSLDGRLHGRYEVADRDVFRPLQYCLPQFQKWPDVNWYARDIVEMSCAHVEALVKRIAQQSRWPFGKALRERKVRVVMDAETYDQASRFVDVYNDAKHGFDHDKDTHMFSALDAVRAYFVARALGNKMYRLARLATNIAVFDQPSLS